MDGPTSEEPMISKTKNMTHPSLVTKKPTDKQLEVFRMLYPIFKDEVFRRREQMMQLTAFAGTFLVIGLFTFLAMPSWSGPTSSTRWFALSGVTVFSSLFAYLILQHAERHRMAKQQLIELEKNLGFYHDGWQANGDAFFPKNWQSDWTADRSVTIYLAILAALTALVLCTILIQI